MFDNIGSKIKSLAKITCWIGIIFSVITSIILISKGNNIAFLGYAFSGIAFLLIGPLCSWVGSFLLYGFGELIEKTTEIAENTRHNNNGDKV